MAEGRRVKLITEDDLRQELGDKKDVREYLLPDGDIITPAARTYLADRKISIRTSDQERNRPRKPEHRTHLNGATLVSKSHGRIRLRGKLDSLEAKILLAQVRMTQTGQSQIVLDLQEVLVVVRSVLRAEVLDVPLEPVTLLGMTEEELHDISHHPEERLNVSHFVPEHTMGEEMALLNWLRTEVRETELAAYGAFAEGQDNRAPGRPDILRVLNRLSSAIYVMMCRLRGGACTRREGAFDG